MMMKRKEVEDVSEDFSDFSLSPPARKIRRLEMGLSPIMEGEESQIYNPNPVVDDQRQTSSNVSGSGWNQEKAIVLYKNPQQGLLSHSPTSSNFTLSLHSDFIHHPFHSQLFRSGGSSVTIKSVEEEEQEEESTNERSSMAIVPWVPSKFNVMQCMDVSQEEGMEVEQMDIEQYNTAESSIEQGGGHGGNVFEFAARGNQELSQWHQQHCLIPNVPYNTTSPPISWSH